MTDTPTAMGARLASLSTLAQFAPWYPCDCLQGIYLVTTVDIADTDEVMDVIGDRLVELQVDEGLPIYVTLLRPIQRVLAELRERKQAMSPSPLPLP